jgi:GT2 family glycosyltransferase/glycosyltransferase involved in cell wall biosynthesis
VAHFPFEPAPSATIVVIGLRDAPMLKTCLESIAENVTGVTYEVIVILNDPTPRLSGEVERDIAGARVFPFRANLGFGGAINFAAERARGGYLVLLNDDCVVERGWLESLVDTEQRREGCAVVGSTYLNPDGSLQEAGALLWSDGTTDAVGAGATAGYMAFERRVDYSSGGSLLIRKDVWDALGGLDDSYYPAYFEDVDFCLRVVEAGWEVWYQPLSAVRHVRSASTAIDFRQFLFRRARETFVERWSSALATRAAKGQEERALWLAMGEPIRVLVIDDQIPDPSLGSGFGRMYDTLSMLEREPDLHVAFYPSTQSRPLPGFFGLRSVRVIADLGEHLATDGVDYDVVVISRPHNGELTKELLARHLPHAHVIYDAESLFHRRLSLQAEVEQDPARRDALLAEAAAVKSREHLVVKAADSVVCISELEAEELREVTDAPVRVVAPFFEAPEPTAAGFEQRADIGFVAGWAAGPGSPNCDALQWFVREVMPKVRVSVPGCRLLVTGANPPSDVTWLDGSVVRFVGSLRDLPAFYNRVRVIISSTRFGAGVKLKTVEAVQYGVPVVCTEEAATGLDDALRAGVWVANDAGAFADAVVALLTDQPTWERQRQLTFARHDASSIQQLGVGLWPAIIRSACSSVKEAEVAR